MKDSRLQRSTKCLSFPTLPLSPLPHSSMSTRKRKRTISQSEAQPRAQPPQAPGTKKPGACVRCRASKLKCELAPGTDTCLRCVSAGVECQLQESRSTRSASVPPSAVRLPQAPSQLKSSHQQQRSNSSTATSRTTTQKKKQKDRMDVVEEEHEITMEELYPIPEDDETVSGNGADNLTFSGSDVLRNTQELLRAIVTGGPAPEDSAESDHSVDVMVRSDDSDHVTSTDGDSELDMQEIIRRFHGENSKGKSKAAVPSNACVAFTAKSRPTAEQPQQEPEEDTRPFKLRCAVQPPNSSSLFTFELPSTITFDNLRIAIRDALERPGEPGLLRLQYRLSSDKQKQVPTCVQSEDQFRIFISQMRPLYLPARTSKGYSRVQRCCDGRRIVTKPDW
ncbi:hypothetical protein JVU11DRAFT_8439 [Chiua virens]|nr:hypothetical protein JVU11DRAFT_8439 [Chiua virens]